MQIHKATLKDIGTLVTLRFAYFEAEHGQIDPAAIQELRPRLMDHFRNHLADDTFIGIYATVDGRLVGSAFLSISEMPPNLSCRSGRLGTVLNVLTYPEFRGRGIALAMMQKLLAEAAVSGVTSIRLSATAAGRGLYEKLGFSVSEYTEMNLEIPQDL